MKKHNPNLSLISMDGEEWLPLPWNPDYEISNYGRLKSNSRAVTDRLGRIRNLRSRIMRTQLDKDGYPFTKIYTNERQETLRPLFSQQYIWN